MPTFTYRARNPDGEQVTGTLVADTSNAAARMLDERALLPTELKQLKEGGRSLLLGRGGRVSASKVGVMYEQLSDLLGAGNTVEVNADFYSIALSPPGTPLPGKAPIHMEKGGLSPEPATMSLLALGGLAVLRKRRK